MNKHIAFPSIDQFRSVIKHVVDNCKHHQVILPVLTFTGTVKLHGTNHGVCRAPNGDMYTQSREHITAFESDNAGSHVWSMQNAELFRSVFANIGEVGVDDTIQIFGEWCGGNIQKGVGLNNVPKMFVVFAIRVSKDAESQQFFSEAAVRRVCEGVLTTVYDFPNRTIEIDFNKPEIAQARLIELTEAVEKDCPVARKLLGPNFEGELVGEGIVWTTVFKGNTLRFKVKGEKHSSSKVKVLAAVDVEKMSSIREFVSSVVTESRLNQGLEHTTAREPKYTGEFLKWVMSDIYKEESDTMVANGFTSKEVSGPMSTAIRQWFLGVQ
jgi:hypothetical protein